MEAALINGIQEVGEENILEDSEDANEGISKAHDFEYCNCKICENLKRKIVKKRKEKKIQRNNMFGLNWKLHLCSSNKSYSKTTQVKKSESKSQVLNSMHLRSGQNKVEAQKKFLVFRILIPRVRIRKTERFRVEDTW